MNKSEEIANDIILKTYKNGGCLEYKNIRDGIPSTYIRTVNIILENYGSLNVQLSDETWFSYTLNKDGNDFASQGAFDGLEKDRIHKIEDRKLDRSSKIISMVAVLIALISLIISIVALRK